MSGETPAAKHSYPSTKLLAAELLCGVGGGRGRGPSGPGNGGGGGGASGGGGLSGGGVGGPGCSWAESMEVSHEQPGRDLWSEPSVSWPEELRLIRYTVLRGAVSSIWRFKEMCLCENDNSSQGIGTKNLYASRQRHGIW